MQRFVMITRWHLPAPCSHFHLASANMQGLSLYDNGEPAAVQLQVQKYGPDSHILKVLAPACRLNPLSAS